MYRVLVVDRVCTPGQVNLVPKGAVARFVDPGIVMLNETKSLTKISIVEANV
jgi:hypothetical protein